MARGAFQTEHLPGDRRTTPIPAHRPPRGDFTAAAILSLQQAAGNRAVQRLLSPAPDRVDDPRAGGRPEAQLQRFPVQVTSRGAAHRMRGGTSMTAIVGGESEWIYGQRPPGKVPNLMTKVGANLQGKHRYVAGHLLNDNMGGLGVNNNLTVLSSDANKLHRGLENKLRTLGRKADQINSGSKTHGDPAYDHGARYSVTVLPPQPAGRPPYAPQERHIGSGLQIDITPIRFHKVSGAESPWPEETSGTLTAHVITNVPPYPAVAPKKKPTPIQRRIVKAIGAVDGNQGATFGEIWKYISANVKKPPKKASVKLALKRGVASRFYYRRGPYFKVIAKNLS